MWFLLILLILCIMSIYQLHRTTGVRWGLPAGSLGWVDLAAESISWLAHRMHYVWNLKIAELGWGGSNMGCALYLGQCSNVDFLTASWTGFRGLCRLQSPLNTLGVYGIHGDCQGSPFSAMQSPTWFRVDLIWKGRIIGAICLVPFLRPLWGFCLVTSLPDPHCTLVLCLKHSSGMAVVFLFLV